MAARLWSICRYFIFTNSQKCNSVRSQQVCSNQLIVNLTGDNLDRLAENMDGYD
jgi:hypothetical protein